MINLITPDFSQIDGFATTIALVGYLVVFVALLLLYIVFNSLPSLLRINPGKLFLRRDAGVAPSKKEEVRVTGEVNAAIGMAIYMYLNEMHDEENAKIKIVHHTPLLIYPQLEPGILDERHISDYYTRTDGNEQQGLIFIAYCKEYKYQSDYHHKYIRQGDIHKTRITKKGPKPLKGL